LLRSKFWSRPRSIGKPRPVPSQHGGCGSCPDLSYNRAKAVRKVAPPRDNSDAGCFDERPRNETRPQNRVSSRDRGTSEPRPSTRVSARRGQPSGARVKWTDSAEVLSCEYGDQNARRLSWAYGHPPRTRPFEKPMPGRSFETAFQSSLRSDLRSAHIRPGAVGKATDHRKSRLHGRGARLVHAPSLKSGSRADSCEFTALRD